MLVFEKIEQATSYQGLSRTGFSFTYIRPLQAYALFGGANSDTNLYLFSINKGTWICQPTTGQKKPPSRKYHAAVFIQSVSCLLVNGGEGDQGNCLEDFFVLSIKDWKWRKLNVVKCPPSRLRHSIFAKSGSELILFGGVSPYEPPLSNDIWLMKVQCEKLESIDLDCYCIKPKSKVFPVGRILAQNIIYCKDRLYAGCFRENSSYLKIFCFDFKRQEWRELQFGERCTQARLFRMARAEDDGFVIALSESERRKNSPCTFFYYQASNNRFRNLESEADIINNCDQFTGDGGDYQTLCLRLGKRLFAVHYNVLSSDEPECSIQDYLIAIKHEQILSKQQTRKNGYLQQLFKEMQSYVTQLHKQYLRFEEDPAVQAARAQHIEDCHTLKQEYANLNQAYEAVSEEVRALRGKMSYLNEDFERCMETEFDEEA